MYIFFEIFFNGYVRYSITLYYLSFLEQAFFPSRYHQLENPFAEIHLPISFVWQVQNIFLMRNHFKNMIVDYLLVICLDIPKFVAFEKTMSILGVSELLGQQISQYTQYTLSEYRISGSRSQPQLTRRYWWHNVFVNLLLIVGSNLDFFLINSDALIFSTKQVVTQFQCEYSISNRCFPQPIVIRNTLLVEQIRFNILIKVLPRFKIIFF